MSPRPSMKKFTQAAAKAREEAAQKANAAEELAKNTADEAEKTEAQARAEQAARLKAQAEAEAKSQAEAEAGAIAEKAELQARQRAVAQAAAQPAPQPRPKPSRQDLERNVSPNSKNSGIKIDLPEPGGQGMSGMMHPGGPSRPGAVDPANQPSNLEEASQFYAMEEEEEDTLKDRYMTFHLAGEDYGLEIRNIIEIIGMQNVTRVPDVADFIKGIINLRGQVIPVMDVRLRFGIEEAGYTERTCIIVVQFNDFRVGLIVDQVRGVRDIPKELISPPPKFSKSGGSSFMAGMGRVGEEVKILLDVQRLLFAGHREDIIQNMKENREELE